MSGRLTVAVAPFPACRGLSATEGRTYREINSWLNRQTKVDSVDAATVEQLDRSIELLQAELDRIGRRRARRAS